MINANRFNDTARRVHPAERFIKYDPVQAIDTIRDML